MPSADLPRPAGGAFHRFMEAAARSGTLVVQPRMGFADPGRMRAGLLATRGADATTVGTLTLDSFTRVGDYAAAARAAAQGHPLNGYPLVSLPVATTTALLDGVHGADFPVQVRHGSALPGRIVDALIAAGLDATEGGPVSYCLPYGRTPLAASVQAWREACRTLAELRATGAEPHLESFGGCMLGQLCPPSLLIALSVLEGMFFRQHGIRSVSLSYAQQTSAEQDEEAVHALRALAADHLPDTSWHVVVYAYMGVYPETAAGALELVADAARLAVRTGAARLIVKTAAEAARIPSVAENVTALETAAAAAARTARRTAPPPSTGVEGEARSLVQAVLGLHDDIGQALVRAFARGYLDVPYCLHPDNAGRTRSVISDRGRLEWSRTGSLPLGRPAAPVRRARRLTSSGLLHALHHVKNRYDTSAASLGRVS
ncbi:methylaspartate mutase [Streptomyces sp. TG1A-8]|uniref:methylaspartate mutase n=1 Tax=Streptomyces sp. TG1A-8 TaxID=3051385 RepID=UPI00265BF24C|nr:methylaspartate mutase [Streptomyces sp. TG1A-8]MDO0928851.1 methylaspartate mutase [Streptomyces sp. TG1A-8]